MGKLAAVDLALNATLQVWITVSARSHLSAGFVVSGDGLPT